MKMKLITTLRALLFVPVLALAVSAVVPATVTYADDCNDAVSLQNGANCAKGTDQQPDLFGANGVFKTITNVLLFIIGAIAVIMLIIGGIRYTVSGGDSNAITSAKNTILYAIVGIVVAILAFAVVNWVIGSFATNK